MSIQNDPRIVTARIETVAQPWMSLAPLLLLNLVMLSGLVLMNHAGGGAWDAPFVAYGVLGSGLLITIAVVVRSKIITPLRRLSQLIRHIGTLVAEERAQQAIAPLSLNHMVAEMARFAQHAQESRSRYQQVNAELERSRGLLKQYAIQQASANREIGEQYRAVIHYAEYLEEQVARRSTDDGMRFDFDEVCESSFNLKIIAQAMESLNSGVSPVLVDVPVSMLLQQTVMALAPALDRRSMKLTSAGMDEAVQAHTDAAMTTQVLWMVLLGIVRYAEGESTLKLRCFHNRERSEAMISMVVSALAPGALTPAERHAHLLRQSLAYTPHMFAETIGQHGNIQLAELLLKRISGQIQVVGLSQHTCEVCIRLPSAGGADTRA